MILTGENQNIRTQPYPGDTQFTKNPTWIRLGSNMSLHGDRPATNHLSYDNAPNPRHSWQEHVFYFWRNIKISCTYSTHPQFHTSQPLMSNYGRICRVPSRRSMIQLQFMPLSPVYKLLQAVSFSVSLNMALCHMWFNAHEDWSCITFLTAAIIGARPPPPQLLPITLPPRGKPSSHHSQTQMKI